MHLIPGHDVTEVTEHGQRWLVCACGAQWSIVETSRGEEYEQVADGDEDYHKEDED